MLISEGIYLYLLTADDGARLWIDGNLFFDVWEPGSVSLVQKGIRLDAGVHTFVVEYHEGTGRARVVLWGRTGE